MGQDHESIGRRDALRRVAGAGAVGAAAWAAPAVTGMSVVPRLAQAQSGGGEGPGGDPCTPPVVNSNQVLPVITCAVEATLKDSGGASVSIPTIPVPFSGTEAPVLNNSAGTLTDPPPIGVAAQWFTQSFITNSDPGVFPQLSFGLSNSILPGVTSTWNTVIIYRLPTNVTVNSVTVADFSLTPYSLPGGSVTPLGSGPGEYAVEFDMPTASTLVPSSLPQGLAPPPPAPPPQPLLFIDATPTGGAISLPLPRSITIVWDQFIPNGTYAGPPLGQTDDWYYHYEASCTSIAPAEIFGTVACVGN